jgi:K+-sensing histidine kinase KdpD
MRVSSENSKILLIDDNEELLFVLNELFSTHGFLVEAVTSVDGAIQTLTEDKPDIILCDVMLPGKLGYELYYHVRENASLADLPFVFLTAVSSEQKRRFAIEQGCDDYIIKPFNPEELISIVRGKLVASRRRKDVVKQNVENDRRRIIQTLSHEFRTPLVSINTGSEIIIEHGEKLDDVQLRRLLESIWRGGQRLERLIDDFMVLQQISLGHAESIQKKFKRELALEDVIESAVQNFIVNSLENPVPEIIVDTLPQDVSLLGYDVQLEDALLRLLSNAQKFGEAGMPIRVSSEVNRDGEIVVRVRDYGPGIEKPGELLQQACEIFSQINRELNEQQGCGLGLAIAAYYTKINLGVISLSQPSDGPGLIAELRFPAV